MKLSGWWNSFYMSKTSEKFRVEWLAADRARDAGLVEPNDVVAFKDVRYGEFGDWNLLDLYLPRGNAEKLPVIVSVHGGAFVYGQKETYKFYLMSLAERGFAVVNFNYRLAPEFKFPAALEDTDAVLHWVFENALKYNLDVENIFMVGDSAGANYAALYAIYRVNPEYACKVQKASVAWHGCAAKINPPEGFKPKAVALNCGLYDLTEEKNSRADTMQDLFGEHLEECCEYLNVMDYVTAQFPPAFVMTGEYDFLKRQAPRMAKTLEANKVPHVLKSYGTVGMKEISHVFHVNMKLALAHACNDEECEFFMQCRH